MFRCRRHRPSTVALFYAIHAAAFFSADALDGESGTNFTSTCKMNFANILSAYVNYYQITAFFSQIKRKRKQPAFMRSSVVVLIKNRYHIL